MIYDSQGLRYSEYLTGRPLSLRRRYVPGGAGGPRRYVSGRKAFTRAVAPFLLDICTELRRRELVRKQQERWNRERAWIRDNYHFFYRDRYQLHRWLMAQLRSQRLSELWGRVQPRELIIHADPGSMNFAISWFSRVWPPITRDSWRRDAIATAYGYHEIATTSYGIAYGHHQPGDAEEEIEHGYWSDVD